MADETDDLDYSETNVGSAQAQGVRKNISLKLKGKGRGRGRRGGRSRRVTTKKAVSGGPDDDDDVEETVDAPSGDTTSDKQFGNSNLDEVISKLETPAFSPMDRTFQEPLHQNKKLRWDHKVNLIGEKVIDPLIHCCSKCLLPILNYGRMIPCKHVFCYDCAKKAEKLCPKCEEKVQRIEQSALGTVFMCTFGGSRHAPGSCGRTYLSQRDLQAHVNHRHLKPAPTSTAGASVSAVAHVVPASTAVSIGPSHVPVSRDPRDPRGHLHVDVSHQAIMVGHIQHQEHRESVDHTRNPSIPMGSPAGQPRQYPHSPANYPSTIPVSSARPNLITVPIQDDGAGHSTAPGPHMHPQTHVPQYATTATTPHPMPSMQHPPSSYPPHAYQHPHPAPTPAYSQAPPMTTQTFTQPPPPVHHQPPIHAPSGPIYSTPPPVVHHAPPPTYTPPRAPQHAPRPLPPPQRFPPSSGNYDENSSYMQQWGPGGVPPPPARTSLPPRPIPAPPPASNPNVGLIQPRGPSDPGYRQPYYQ